MSTLPRATTLGGLTLHDFEPSANSLCDDVVKGLSQPERRLAPKYFYDQRGAVLFERICQLEAYYPTRTELDILQRYAGEIAERLGSGCRVLEFGSGSGLKTRILLRRLRSPVAYVPVDISRAQLVEFGRSIAEEFPALEVLPVCADYTGTFVLPPTTRPARRTVAFFPGSTIGNFEPGAAEAFLRHVGELCGPGGACVIGVDLKKDPALIERAYNDPEGVTAEFNLNLLRRINRECGADFDLSAFRHHAFYDADLGRIEMRLVSARDQVVTVPPPPGWGTPLRVSFRAGDHITTEYSYKYDVEEFGALAARAGWQVSHVWTDERRWFGEWLLERSG